MGPILKMCCQTTPVYVSHLQKSRRVLWSCRSSQKRLVHSSFIQRCAEIPNDKAMQDKLNVKSSRANSQKLNIIDNNIQDFVASLTVNQRGQITEELKKAESLDARQKAEDKLASSRWRSRFGRPSIEKLGADPTGTYCELPETWVKAKAKLQAKPTPKQLRQLALFNALPFIGFGFLDNVIMILAGDYIDLTIGTALGISTMAAAALGNTISDLAGIGSAWYVEIAAERVGVTAPRLSPHQLASSGARWSANSGRAFGVVFGCILGMFPLLFMEGKKRECVDVKEDEKDAELLAE